MAHHSEAEEGYSPVWAHPRRGNVARSSELEAGGPEDSLTQLEEEEAEVAAAGPRTAGHNGATVRHNEAHGCHSAGACCSCEALVVRSCHRHSRKVGGRTRGMAVCPGTQAGDCRTERMGELKIVAAGASSCDLHAQAHRHCTDPSYTSAGNRTANMHKMSTQ